MAAQNECGARYRRTMYESPGSRVCTKPPHEGGRHSDQGHIVKRESDNPDATCQICFRSQKARSSRLVLHGYKRPGWGYTVGECWGVGYEPFEVSCERTKQFLAEVLRPTLARFEADLTRLQAGPESLEEPVRVWLGYGHPKAAKSGYGEVKATVKKGDRAQNFQVPDLFEHPSKKPVEAHAPAYDYLLDRLISRKEGQIRMCKTDIKTFEKKVAEWKPVPWPAIKAVA